MRVCFIRMDQVPSAVPVGIRLPPCHNYELRAALVVEYMHETYSVRAGNGRVNRFYKAAGNAEAAVAGVHIACVGRAARIKRVLAA